MSGDYHNDRMVFGQDVVRSRRLLIATLEAFTDQRESFTVIGAHAVIERTTAVEREFGAASTRDADLAVIPQLLSDSPTIASVMDAIGLELAHADRPGIWGLKSESGLDMRQRLTIDIIAPEALAGKGTRSATVGPHGRRSVTRALGIELSTLDRSILPIRAFDDTQSDIHAYVAGVPALIAAKAHKIHDRLNPSIPGRRADRWRPKDAVDLYRLIKVSAPENVAAVFSAFTDDDQVSAVARNSVQFLVKDSARISEAVADWLTDDEPDDVRQTISAWISELREAYEKGPVS